MKASRNLWLGLLVLLLLPLPAAADELDDIAQLVERKGYAEATDRLERVLAATPRDPRARFLKGVILTEQKRRDQAIEVFNGLVKDFPDLPEPYNNLAVLHAESGDYDAAAEALRRAIKTHPSYATAHENLGDIYAKMASLAYGKALQLNQQHNRENSTAEAKLALVKKLFGTPGIQPEPTPVVSAAPELTSPPPRVEVAARPEPPARVEPAPKPEPAPRVEKGPAAFSQDDLRRIHNEVSESVLAWAKAWSGQDVRGYLASYASEFRPPAGLTRQAWERSREQKLKAPRFISVRLGNMNVHVLKDREVRVTFVQNYRSDNYSDQVTKTLLMRKVEGRWKIVQELADG